MSSRKSVLTPKHQTAVQWDFLWQEFATELEINERSPRTIQSYAEALGQLREFLRNLGLAADDPAGITAEHIRHYLAHLKDVVGASPATRAQRRRSLNRFFGWLVEQGELTDNPIAKVPAPKIPERITEALTPEQVRALLAACDVTTRYGVRDYALILVLYDTGLRAGELLQMDVDPASRYEGLRVVGKGNRERAVRLGGRARQAVMRYARRWRLGTGRLWRGRAGEPLTVSGLLQMFRRLGKRIGLHLYTHLMRHTFATNMMDTDAPRDSIRTLAGWTSDAMLRRYSVSRESQRAIETHKRYSPGDRLYGK